MTSRGNQRSPIQQQSLLKPEAKQPRKKSNQQENRIAGDTKMRRPPSSYSQSLLYLSILFTLHLCLQSINVFRRSQYFNFFQSCRRRHSDQDHHHPSRKDAVQSEAGENDELDDVASRVQCLTIHKRDSPLKKSNY